MEEVKIGFLRGIGFYIATIFIGVVISLIGFIIFNIYRFSTRECINIDNINGKKVCLKYKYN